MDEKTGKITEKLGQWTNDRDVEARGRAEQDDADSTSVEDEKDQVRREHGDVSR